MIRDWQDVKTTVNAGHFNAANFVIWDIQKRYPTIRITNDEIGDIISNGNLEYYISTTEDKIILTNIKARNFRTREFYLHDPNSTQKLEKALNCFERETQQPIAEPALKSFIQRLEQTLHQTLAIKQPPAKPEPTKPEQSIQSDEILTGLLTELERHNAIQLANLCRQHLEKGGKGGERLKDEYDQLMRFLIK